MQGLHTYAFILLTLLMSSSGFAETQALDYFRDSSTRLTLSDIQEDHIQWQSTDRSLANFGFTDDVIWLRIPLNNPSSQAAVKFLRINYPLLDHVNAYLTHQGQTLQHTYLSDRVAYNENRQHDKYYLFKYTLAAQTNNHVFIKIQTESSMTLPIEIFTAKEYVQAKTLENYWFGALYGTLIIMGLYNFIIAITLRSLVYFLYVGYLAGFSFLISSLNGDGFQYLWPNYPEFNNQTPLIGAAWPSLFMMPLAYYFLQIKHYAPILASVYKGLYLIVLISIPSLFFLDYQIGSKLMNGINIIMSPIILITALNFAWHKRAGAKTFALAWLALVISLTMLSLSIYNIIPSSVYTRQAYSFGGLLELVIISLALARQINQSIYEKNSALKASELHLKKYQELFHNSPSGIFTANTNGQIITYNNAFARIMEFEKLDTNRLNLFENLGKNPIEIQRLISHLEMGQHIAGLPILCLTTQGNERWFAMTLHLQGEYQQRTIEGHIIDIHDRMRRQQEKENQDQQRMESLTLLIAGISHEINTPLGNNLTTLSLMDELYNELAQDCTEQPPVALESLHTSLGLLKHNTLRTVELMKRFTLVSTGYLQATPVTINGENMLRTIALDYQQRLQDLTINTHYKGPETFTSYQDPLTIIFESLIDNSIKHGLIETDNATIDIELTVKDGHAEISYHDNGKGIDNAIKDKIFQPFFTTSRGNEETSGLGLYAIDNIVKNLFHGSISISSTSPEFQLNITLAQLNNQDRLDK